MDISPVPRKFHVDDRERREASDALMLALRDRGLSAVRSGMAYPAGRIRPSGMLTVTRARRR